MLIYQRVYNGGFSWEISCINRSMVVFGPGIYHDLKPNYKMLYPLVICYIAIENDPVEIVDFPINSMVIFQFAMLNYQRDRKSVV